MCVFVCDLDLRSDNVSMRNAFRDHHLCYDKLELVCDFLHSLHGILQSSGPTSCKIHFRKRSFAQDSTDIIEIIQLLRNRDRNHPMAHMYISVSTTTSSIQHDPLLCEIPTNRNFCFS